MKKRSLERNLFLICLVFHSLTSHSQNRSVKVNQREEEFLSYPVNIADELEIFHSGDTNAAYRILLCADIPNDKKPWRVARGQQTGHVFLVLQKTTAADTVNKVFGFYPKKGLPTLFFKKIKSTIKDNSKRVYDTDITKELSAAEFDLVLAKSIFYAQQIYHINKFNCYDYALEIFNSIAGKETLPVSHVRFPFIYGKGGSPCSLYKDLKKLKESNSFWAPYIRFGNLTAPVSTGRIIQKINRTPKPERSVARGVQSGF
jgi:hypothetical protein